MPCMGARTSLDKKVGWDGFEWSKCGVCMVSGDDGVPSLWIGCLTKAPWPPLNGLLAEHGEGACECSAH